MRYFVTGCAGFIGSNPTGTRPCSWSETFRLMKRFSYPSSPGGQNLSVPRQYWRISFF
jgi:hypothetical protein